MKAKGIFCWKKKKTCTFLYSHVKLIQSYHPVCIRSISLFCPEHSVYFQACLKINVFYTATVISFFSFLNLAFHTSSVFLNFSLPKECPSWIALTLKVFNLFQSSLHVALWLPSTQPHSRAFSKISAVEGKDLNFLVSWKMW